MTILKIPILISNNKIFRKLARFTVYFFLIEISVFQASIIFLFVAYYLRYYFRFFDSRESKNLLITFRSQRQISLQQGFVKQIFVFQTSIAFMYHA